MARPADRLSTVTKTARGLGCLILFALPFAIVGLVAAFLAGLMLWSWGEARDWREVTARILQVQLESHTGDDSTTYEVVARYEYEFAGITYQGDRVGLGTGADNIGSFHQDAYRELEDFRVQSRPFRCFVDPDNPSRAILYRDMRWGLFSFIGLFALLFGGVGFGLVILGFEGRRSLEEGERLRASFPDEPWRWKSDWAGGRVPLSGKARFLLPAMMAVFWNLVSTPLLLVLPEEVLEKGNHLALIGLVFPLVGVGLLIWAGRSFVRWKKFGDSVFEMSTFPGVIGGRLRGRVLTSVDLQPAEGYRLTLSCVRRVTTGSGKNRSTSERILWQDEQRLERELAEYDPTRSEIPIEFEIPFDCRPTEERSQDDEVLWRLIVDAEVPGVDYAASFEVPVFRTADSRQTLEPERSPWSSAEPPRLSERDLAQSGIDSELLATGASRLTFRAARHRGPAVALTLFLVVWLGFCALFVHLDAPLVFPILWGLFALLIFLGVLDLWLERRTIEIHPDRLVLQGGLLGLGRKREIPRTQVREVRSVRGMQSGKRLFYQIHVDTADGRTHVAATKIDNLSLAREIIELLTADS